MEFTVGQKLWYVPGSERRGTPHLVTITAVGRKWISLDDGYYRFEKADATMRIDGGNYMSPGRCYRSQEAWQVETALKAAWKKFREDIIYETNVAPSGMTLERIEEARRILFGEE